MTRMGRGGVFCSNDILKEWGGEAVLKSCVFICTSAVITVFNVNPVVFFIFFLS